MGSVVRSQLTYCTFLYPAGARWVSHPGGRGISMCILWGAHVLVHHQHLAPDSPSPPSPGPCHVSHASVSISAPHLPMSLLWIPFFTSFILPQSLASTRGTLSGLGILIHGWGQCLGWAVFRCRSTSHLLLHRPHCCMVGSALCGTGWLGLCMPGIEHLSFPMTSHCRHVLVGSACDVVLGLGTHSVWCLEAAPAVVAHLRQGQPVHLVSYAAA